MSLTKKSTLYICKTNCYKCNKEYNAAYEVKIIGGKKYSLSPESFSDATKKLAEENGVIIETLAYGNLDYSPDIYTVNVCPYCNAPFGNSHINELIGHEFKAIETFKDNESIDN